METLHTIDYNDIKTSIGSPKQAVDLIRDLIWAEGGRQRIDLTKISISSKIYQKDGGIDGTVDIKSQIEPGLLSEGKTYFQIKWGSTFDPRKKNKLELELTKNNKLKPKIRSLAESAGRYVLIWFGDRFVGSEKDDCQENIKEIFLKNGFPTMKISVLDQDDIANFCNLHPPIISKYFIPLTDFFLTINSWKDKFWNEEIHGKDVENIIQQNFSTVNTIIRSNINSPYTSIQLISKDENQYLINRILVYKTLSHEMFSSHTVCVDAEQFGPPLSTTLESRHDLNQIIVIDNCTKEHHQKILDVLGQRSRRLSMIVLSTDHEIIKNQNFSKIGWHGSEHSVFLKEIQKTDYADKVTTEFFYEPKVPTLKKIRPANYIDSSYRQIAGQYGYEALMKSKRVLRYLALFSSIGSENNRTKELEYLAEKAGFENKNWLDFIEIIHVLRNSGLITGKFFIKITNSEHRRFLIQEWWEVYGPVFDFYGFLANTYTFSERLAGRLIGSLPYITSSEKGQEIARILLGEYGPFASGKLLNDDFGTRLFNKLSEADPQTALTCLSNTIGTWSIEDLKKYDNRRDIVFALEKILWWEELFDDAAYLLLRLSEAENEEGISNNSTGVFTSLFSSGYGRLAPTEKPPLKRFDIIEKIFDSKIESRILIALKACDTALQSRYFSRIIAGDGPWAGRVFRPWMPKTYGELFDYYKEVWTFLEKQIDVLPLNLKNNIVKILTNNARGLITIKYLSKMVAETIDKLSQKPEIDKGPIVDAIYSIIKFEKEKLESNIISILEEADKKITGIDFHTKLQRYVGMYNMLRDLGNKSSPEIQELAKEGIKNKNLIKKELPILVRSGLKKSYHFGYEVGKIDKNFSLFKEIIKEQKKTDEKNQDLSFLAGYCKAIFEKQPSELEKILNNLSESLKTVKWIPSIIYGSRINLNDNDLNRLIKLTKNKKIDVSELYRFYLGGTTRLITEKVFLEFCKILKIKQEGYFHLLEFYYQYFIMPKKTLPKKYTYGLLCDKFINKSETELQFNPSTFSYVEIAKKFVVGYPDLGLKLIKKYLDEGNKEDSFLSKFDSEFDEIITELVKIKPDEIWKLISRYIQIPIDLTTYRIRSWLRGTSFFVKETHGGLEYLKMEQVFNWIKKDPKDRAWFIALTVPHTLQSKSGQSSWARELLAKYWDLKSVRKEVIANFSTEGFSGSEVEHYKNKKEELLEFQKQETDQRVKQWIDEYLRILNADIERGQKFEESFEF